MMIHSAEGQVRQIKAEPDMFIEGSEERSSATPSNDEFQDLDDDMNGHDEYPEDDKNVTLNQVLDAEKRIDPEGINDIPLTTAQKIDRIESSFVYVQHQLSRIMRTLHVAPCICHECNQIHQQISNVRQLSDPASMLSSLFPNASSQQLQTLVDLSRMNKLPSQLVTQNGTPATTHYQPQQLQQPPPSAMMKHHNLGAGYGGAPGGGKMVVDKKMVAEYARLHGGAAAAKKFGIAPPVATFYQRKDSSQALNNPAVAVHSGMPHLPMAATTTPGTSTETPTPTPIATSAPVLDFEDNKQQVAAVATTHENSTPTVTTQPQAFPQSMVDMIKMNAAHNSGSPGFLRGRGRGRPKLIGDELDADLVDYMVSIKKCDPHGHLTASQALNIAKQYILEKAPGLLEEHGGHVKLKLTWAMKLVSRIAEREKEIELGLPAGTLSNIGRQHLASFPNLPGGNFMADMVAQNFLSQTMMNLGQSQQQQPQQPETSKNEDSEKVQAPEIVGVKELNLPFLNNLLADIVDKNGGEIEGEIKQEDDEIPDQIQNLMNQARLGSDVSH